MRLEVLGANRAELHLNDCRILFSYGTVVAVRAHGVTYVPVAGEEPYDRSVTTSRHIGDFAMGALVEVDAMEWQEIRGMTAMRKGIAEVECPDCGELIKPLGLAAHRAGRFCAAQAARNWAESEGLVRFESHTTGRAIEALIEKEKLDVRIECVGDTAYSGAPGRKGKTTSGYWSEDWVVRIAESAVPLAKRKKAIKTAATDLEAREASLLALDTKLPSLLVA